MVTIAFLSLGLATLGLQLPKVSDVLCFCVASNLPCFEAPRCREPGSAVLNACELRHMPTEQGSEQGKGTWNPYKVALDPPKNIHGALPISKDHVEISGVRREMPDHLMPRTEGLPQQDLHRRGRGRRGYLLNVNRPGVMNFSPAKLFQACARA